MQNSRFLPALLLSVLLTLAGDALYAGPVDADGRPLIQKLGTVEVDRVENSPVIFNDRLYRFEWHRYDYFHFVDYETGSTSTPFAHGWNFGNAFVEGDTAYVTGTKDRQIRMWSSRDLESWDARTVLNWSGDLFNTSICKAGDQFVMMFEVSNCGTPFTARFATSTDLEQWTVTPPECNYARNRYTAPHCLRYLDGYYYDFYLEHTHGYQQYVVRSEDLIHWESTPLNPVLRASADDKLIRNPDLTPEQRARIAAATDINNSDIDFCEYEGRLVIFYSWGNQAGNEFLAEAVYEGTQAEFLLGWFGEEGPEPGTLALLATGLVVGLLCYAWRKRK